MRGFTALLVLGLTATAHAGVTVGVGVPFSAAQLQDALDARDAASVDVEVLAVTPETLQLVTPGRRWRVALGPARGAAAARLVALNVAELGQSVASAAAPSIDASVAPPSGGRRVRITALASLARGVESRDVATAGGALEVSIGGRQRGRWSLGVAGEWHRGLTVDPEPGLPIRSSVWEARAVVARTLGRVDVAGRDVAIEVAGGPLAGRLRVDGGTAAHAWLFGAGASARVRWPIAGGWSLTGSIGVDGHHHRVEVRLSDRLLAATPWVAVAASIGVSREVTP